MAATVVLVPGAWHGAWCFDLVVPRVRAAGVEVVAVDLPGHGRDGGPLEDLFGDAARVREVLDQLGAAAGVVLVGHSYGGAVITQAGTHPAVRELVYLCAFPADADESCANIGQNDPAVAAISHEGRPNLGHAFVYGDDGSLSLTPAGAIECLYNGIDAELVEWALEHLGPQSLVALGQSPTTVAWRERPSTYVVCLDDQAVHPELQQILAARCTTTVTWPTSHSPFLSHPQLVADLLVERAQAAS